MMERKSFCHVFLNLIVLLWFYYTILKLFLIINVVRNQIIRDIIVIWQTSVYKMIIRKHSLMMRRTFTMN